MLAILLVLPGACGSKRDGKPSSGSAHPPGDAAVSPAIDLVTTGPITLTGVRVVPVPYVWTDDNIKKPTPGVFELEFTPSRSQHVVRPRMRCRVADRNVLVLVGGPGALAEGVKTSAVFDPRPLAVAATACQFDFYVGAVDEQRPTTLVATACYDGGKLVNGACAADKFPAPALPDGVTALFERVKFPLDVETRPFALSFDGFVTIGGSVAEGREYQVSTRCKQGDTVRTSRSPDNDRVWLDDPALLPVGSSVYIRQSSILDGAIDATARCDVQLVSRPAGTRDSVTIHATQCFAGGRVALGPCP